MDAKKDKQYSDAEEFFKMNVTRYDYLFEQHLVKEPSKCIYDDTIIPYQDSPKRNKPNHSFKKRDNSKNSTEK